VRFLALVTCGFTGSALAISTSFAARLRRLSSSQASSATRATPARAPMMIPAIAPPEMLLPPVLPLGLGLGALPGDSARLPAVVRFVNVVAPGPWNKQKSQATAEPPTAATVEVILEPESAYKAEPCGACAAAENNLSPRLNRLHVKMHGNRAQQRTVLSVAVTLLIVTAALGLSVTARMPPCAAVLFRKLSAENSIAPVML